MQSAALIEAIIINHPFIDSNKRTGYVVIRSFLLKRGLDIVATQDEKYDFVINIASGKIGLQEIILWLNNHIVEQQH